MIFPNKISGSINSNRLGNKITYFSGGTIDRRTGVFSFVTDDGNHLSGISVNGISIPQNIEEIQMSFILNLNGIKNMNLRIVILSINMIYFSHINMKSY